MSLAVIHTRARLGITAPKVLAEVHLSNGLPALNIVGMPETAVRESKDRVRSAIINAGFEFPPRRITINLAPADLPKEGGRFDLAIALGILIASRQIPAGCLEDYECMGELSLSGEIRGVPGILPAVIAASEVGHKVLIPSLSLPEAIMCSKAEVYGAGSLLAATAHLTGNQTIQPGVSDSSQMLPASLLQDLAFVRGHFQARRALEIAATGGHGLLMSGPPGTGKTMLAKCLPGILPSLREQEALEVASIHSLCGHSIPPWKQPPWRAPHHSASSVALTGGGTHPRPGEISLAHRGVLFLDELPEFDRKSLEILRQPLESGEIHISRARYQMVFPARFQLIAAMNPCPCGFLGDKQKTCKCTPDQVQRYRRKLSGPLLDRIDIQIEVGRLPTSTLLDTDHQLSEPSEVVRQRVSHTREKALSRQGCLNAELPGNQLLNRSGLGSDEKQFLEMASTKLQLSGRGLQRLLRVARTIADIDTQVRIQKKHLMEAVSFRQIHTT